MHTSRWNFEPGDVNEIYSILDSDNSGHQILTDALPPIVTSEVLLCTQMAPQVGNVHLHMPCWEFFASAPDHIARHHLLLELYYPMLCVASKI
eukprot:5241035-Amphidinium_carterae.1